MMEEKMMEEKWYKVETTDYYGEFEGVKGLPLEKGQAIEVQWPDGTVTRERLSVLNGRGSAQVDMNGSPDVFPTQRLMILKSVHGMGVFVPLRRDCIKIRPVPEENKEQ